jgi:hypothetical protein
VAFAIGKADMTICGMSVFAVAMGVLSIGPKQTSLHRTCPLLAGKADIGVAS